MEFLKKVFGEKKAEKSQNENKKQQLAELYRECRRCTACELAQQKVGIVHPTGNPYGKIMFITAKPLNRNERNFLMKALEREKILPKDYFVTNIVKCYIKRAVIPDLDTVKACAPMLKKEVEIVKPSIVVALGIETMKLLMGSDKPVPKSVRGKLVTVGDGSPVFAKETRIFNTYYPAYVMNNPGVAQLFASDTGRLKSMLEIVVSGSLVAVD